MPPARDLRRRIPQVAKLLERPALREAIAAFGRASVDASLAASLSELRRVAEAGDEPAFDAALQAIEGRVVSASRSAASPSLRRVINATGVIVHTNLGRAPLSEAVAARVADVAASYTNLEFNLESGGRGDREAHSETRLRAITGAEASVVVNNNAAAVLLAVNTFAEGREVIVSRGELVEIGGSFRIPEILRKGGAQLREVGTTNRTRIADYAKAIGPATGLILRVHPSNFRIVGFTESAHLAELVALGRERGVRVVEDLGSGLLDHLAPPLDGEATLAQSLAAGVDVVTASGDKLLGGPQAGLLAGREDAVAALRRNPLYRALRVDKMTIAALDAVLALHQAGRAADLPVPRMLATPAEELRARAESWRSALAPRVQGVALRVEAVASAAGGGAAPDTALPSFALFIASSKLSPDSLAERLRSADVPIIARIADDALILDPRTVLPGQDEILVETLILTLASGALS